MPTYGTCLPVRQHEDIEPSIWYSSFLPTLILTLKIPLDRCQKYRYSKGGRGTQKQFIDEIFIWGIKFIKLNNIITHVGWMILHDHNSGSIKHVPNTRGADSAGRSDRRGGERTAGGMAILAVAVLGKEVWIQLTTTLVHCYASLYPHLAPSASMLWCCFIRTLSSWTFLPRCILA